MTENDVIPVAILGAASFVAVIAIGVLLLTPECGEQSE